MEVEGKGGSDTFLMCYLSWLVNANKISEVQAKQIFYQRIRIKMLPTLGKLQEMKHQRMLKYLTRCPESPYFFMHNVACRIRKGEARQLLVKLICESQASSISEVSNSLEQSNPSIPSPSFRQNNAAEAEAFNSQAAAQAAAHDSDQDSAQDSAIGSDIDSGQGSDLYAGQDSDQDAGQDFGQDFGQKEEEKKEEEKKEEEETKEPVKQQILPEKKDSQSFAVQQQRHVVPTQKSEQDSSKASQPPQNQEEQPLAHRRVQSEAVSVNICKDEDEKKMESGRAGAASISLIDRSLICADAMKFLEKHNIKTGNTQQWLQGQLVHNKIARLDIKSYETVGEVRRAASMPVVLGSDKKDGNSGSDSDSEINEPANTQLPYHLPKSATKSSHGLKKQ